MTFKQFFGKFKSWSLWANLVGMVVFVVLLAVGVKYGLELFTHHGERIAVPKLLHMKVADAEHVLKQMGLQLEVADSGYFKTLPPGVILEQSIAPGDEVKSGRTIYVTINATSTPTLTLPDIIDNSSLREAMAKLRAMGFKLGQPQFVPGESDWVYGVLVDGKHVVYGDKIPIESTLIIQVGNGMRSAEDSVFYTDPLDLSPEDEFEESEEEDAFEEVEQAPDAPDEPVPEPPAEPVTEE